MGEDAKNGRAKSGSIFIREIDLDDLPVVFHLGERLFTAKRVPNLYRTRDELEIVTLYQTEPQRCFVAETAGGTIGGFARDESVRLEQVRQAAALYRDVLWALAS